MEEVNKPLDDHSFVVHILRENSSIPMILTDQDEKVVDSYNLDLLDKKILSSIKNNHPGYNDFQKDSLFEIIKTDSLKGLIAFWQKDHKPIDIDLVKGQKQRVFYFDSVYFNTEKLKLLEKSRDSLTNAFTEELIMNEHLVPVLFIDKDTRRVIATNVSDYDSTNVNSIIAKFSAQNDSIAVDLGNGEDGVIYFEYSPEITQMKYFPFVQFFIIGLFVLIAYLGFSTFRKAEQDQVWVGMAKETAHQLGTPISSLMAWNQLLEAQGVEQSITQEIDKDIERLNTVTNRFSKIGSEAILVEENVVQVIQNAVDYLKKRISSRIELNYKFQQPVVLAMINNSLLEWVIENITKNAVDAMEGTGKIEIELSQIEDDVIIDISDNGKGIHSSKLKTVFQPGFTTKKRGWGLGLSLVKRIIEDFHKGKVYVLKSELNVGTTFRITLKV
jgi:signal transduction histidine kinase